MYLDLSFNLLVLGMFLIIFGLSAFLSWVIGTSRKNRAARIPRNTRWTGELFLTCSDDKEDRKKIIGLI